MVKVVAYYRVSTDNQNPKRQEQEIKQYCTGFNLSIVKEFTEIESGKIKIRPGLTSLIDFVSNSNNEIDYVIISEISRLGRTSEVLRTVEKLTDLKIGLISKKECLTTLNENKTKNATAEMILGVMSALNSYELETMKIRCNSGMLTAARAGKVSGGYNPYGYQKENNVSKKLVINKLEAEVVKQIFNWYNEGISTYEITNRLNEQNIPTRSKVKKFKVSTVYAMLNNPIYKGIRMFKGETIKAPKIISIVDFDKAQSTMKHNDNKTNKSSKNVFLFNSKILVCGICGKTYFAKKRSETDQRYMCNSNRYHNEYCGNYGISIPKLEQSVQKFLLDYFFDYIIEKRTIKDNYDSELLTISNELIRLNKDLKKESIKEKKLLDSYLNDLISKELHGKESLKIKSNQSDIIQSIENETIKKNELNLMIKSNNNTDLIKENWRVNGINKELINKVISKIVITRDENVKLSTNKIDRVVKVQVYVNSICGTFWISQRSNKIEIDKGEMFFNKERVKLFLAYPDSKKRVVKKEIETKFKNDLTKLIKTGTK